MRLQYDSAVPASAQPLILSDSQGRRVELHLRFEDDGTITLLALAGSDASLQPQKILHQGPYHHPDQPTAAKRAIVAQLKSAAFEISTDQQARWSLSAQRSIKAARHQREEARGDYRFDPKDVYLDW